MPSFIILFLAVSLIPASFAQESAAPAADQSAEGAVQPETKPSEKMRAAAQRNENVPVYQIDNNAIKEANIRLGSSITLIAEPSAQRSYFGSEFGRAPGALVVPATLQPRPSWHAAAFEWHQNSVFNARTFFQVGKVKPSRRNFYGGRFSTPVGKRAWFSADASQRKIRGMVNGNVLVPQPDERVPKATDPAVAAEVARFLHAFPDELPNRPDFDPRALNTNAPQTIDEVQGTFRLDRDLAAGRLTLLYNISQTQEHAFQLVAGMNPDTEIHAQRAQAAYTLSPNPNTDVSLSLSFQRTRSVLAPEPNAVGPRVRLGYQIQELGPNAEFPVDRALNTFRGGGFVSRRLAGGRHTLTAGGDLTRIQLNSVETLDARGYYYFGNNFGRGAIDNFLYGTPSFYAATVGYFPRGFRNWASSAYVADRWQACPRLQVYLGLRYSLLTRPVEVNGLDTLPYKSDGNNFAPRVALAWRAGWGWTWRASYAVSYAGIEPVTYQQVRNNLPLVRSVGIQNPDFLNPLGGLNLDKPGGRSVPTFFSPELVSPYAHQYTASLERGFGRDTQLRLAYIGSRGVKLINSFTLNRGEPTPGIPLTLQTVDQRRPDPRYYDTYLILNGGLAYFNAGQVTVGSRPARGLQTSLTYTFSKAIDDGSDYTATAANNDLLGRRNQWQYESFKDRRGLSNFDTTHAFLLNYSYDLPGPGGSNRWAAAMLRGWQLAGAVLLKTGTPFTLFVGSDAPGFGNVDGGSGDRPNIIDPSILGMAIKHPDTSTSILARERFAFITPGERRGSLARNSFRKAPIRNWNASVSKMWSWSGSRVWTLVLRGEAYNVTNTAQFDEPQRNLTSPSFGRITNTLNDGRVLQLGLQLML